MHGSGTNTISCTRWTPPRRSAYLPAMVSLNRVVMQKSSRALIRALGPETLDVAEVSGKWGRGFTFRSYRQFLYPEWDICAGPYAEGGKTLKFDGIKLFPLAGHPSLVPIEPRARSFPHV